MNALNFARRRRVAAVILPRWPTDRLKQRLRWPENDHRPLVIYEKAQSALRICAVDEHAQRLGLTPGMALTQARAMCPQIAPVEATPETDRSDFRAFAEKLISYSPLIYIHAVGEAFIDITGCERLFGCEEIIFSSLESRLKASGYVARLAIADTAGAAWAAARYGGGGILTQDRAKEALASLPVEALRLEPQLAENLRRLGLKRIFQLYEMPRAPLTARFSDQLLRRLGQATGASAEPLSPVRPAPQFFTDLKLGEPISTLDAVRECLAILAESLSDDLSRAKQGGRRFELTLFRVDNSFMSLQVRTGVAASSAAHIRRLFDNRLEDFQDEYDAGFGIDHLRLSAFEAGRIMTVQHGIFERSDDGEALAELKDRLSNRLGAENVCGIRFQDTHLPEQAAVMAPVITSGPNEVEPSRELRPIKLLSRPEEIEALAQVPDGPPARFVWRRIAYAVARASGPERISDEWWRKECEDATRDYYRIEDENGRRYWIYRQGLYGRETARPRWYLHGFFA